MKDALPSLSRSLTPQETLLIPHNIGLAIRNAIKVVGVMTAAFSFDPSAPSSQSTEIAEYTQIQAENLRQQALQVLAIVEGLDLDFSQHMENKNTFDRPIALIAKNETIEFNEIQEKPNLNSVDFDEDKTVLA